MASSILVLLLTVLVVFSSCPLIKFISFCVSFFTVSTFENVLLLRSSIVFTPPETVVPTLSGRIFMRSELVLLIWLLITSELETGSP